MGNNQYSDRKIVVRVPQAVHDSLAQWATWATARGPKGKLRPLLGPSNVPRYAETARVLIISELVPANLCVGMAVLANSTLILSAASSQVTYRSQELLLATAARLGDVSPKALDTEYDRTTSQSGVQKTRKGLRAAPVINLTMDTWLYHKLTQIASRVDVGGRSSLSHVIKELLAQALGKPKALAAVLSAYAEAVVRIRLVVDTAMDRELVDLQRRLEQVG